MFEWFYNNETLIWWLLLLSGISLLATLIVVPVVLVKLPRDYFLSPERHRVPWSERNRYLRLPFYLAKNLLGALFILAGILMLVLPGQGILTIIIGLVLMEFPGKYHAEYWLINRPSVLQAINWIRTKVGEPELLTRLNED